jgi:hypothetical protein
MDIFEKTVLGKGGEGSGNWNAPGDPRFARENFKNNDFGNKNNAVHRSLTQESVKKIIPSNISKKDLKNLQFKFVDKNITNSPMEYFNNTISIQKTDWSAAQFSNSVNGQKFYENNKNMTTLISRSAGKEYNIEGDGDLSGEINKNMIIHEIGHHVYNQMTDEEKNNAINDKQIQKVSTYITALYDDYIQDRQNENTSNRAVESKSIKEKFAEAYRLHYLDKQKFKIFNNKK